MNTKRNDYTGQTFWETLTALYLSDGVKYGGEYLWTFSCVCGNTVSLRPSQVKAGRHKSCGCMQAELVDKAKRLPNGEAAFRQLYRAYKRASIRRGYSFDLSEDEFRVVTKQFCYYCGNPPTQIYRIKANNTLPYRYNGVDRVDNSVGYTPDNVVSCCGTCNRMKMDMSFVDFVRYIQNIYENRVGMIRLDSEIT